MLKTMSDPDTAGRLFEAAAHATVPWSSDPTDDVDWVRDDDGTLHLYPAQED